MSARETIIQGILSLRFPDRPGVPVLTSWPERDAEHERLETLGRKQLADEMDRAKEEYWRSLDADEQRPDADYWARLAKWTPDEAVLLMMGYEPRRYPRGIDFPWSAPSFVARFTELSEIVSRHFGEYVKVPPPDMLALWDRLHLEVPATLREAVNGIHGQPDTPQGPRWPWGEYETTLLRHLDSAARKWWVNYDLAQPDTAPTNEQVKAWLKQQGVSTRVAEVMAQILRADDLPSGPRR